MKRIRTGYLVITGVWLALIAVFASYVLWYRWDSGTNRGFTFGYYGEYNTVSNALARLPGVTILSTGYNPDITLEEFGFEVRTSEGRELHVWFSEDDSVRSMSGQ